MRSTTNPTTPRHYKRNNKPMCERTQTTTLKPRNRATRDIITHTAATNTHHSTCYLRVRLRPTTTNPTSADRYLSSDTTHAMRERTKQQQKNNHATLSQSRKHAIIHTRHTHNRHTFYLRMRARKMHNTNRNHTQTTPQYNNE